MKIPKFAKYSGVAARHVFLAMSAVIFGSGLVANAAISYDFNDGTLQGWHNRVWDASAAAWVDLDPNVSTMPSTINGGAIQPPSGNNNLFGVGRGNTTQVDPVGGNTDGHLNTLWLRSPVFYPVTGGDLTVQMARGKAHGSAPANDGSVSYIANSSTGWKGVALRRVSDGVFVLAKPRTSEGDGMQTVTFTEAELTPYAGVACTLDLINSENGGWGWLSMDNVAIPGSAVPPGPQAFMTSFGFPTFGPATISGTSITMYVPNGTVVTSLAPTFTLSSGASCTVNGNPVNSGDPFDFTNPVHYLVSSSDHLITNDYVVTVNVVPRETTIRWNTGTGNWNTSTANWLGQVSNAVTTFFDDGTVNVIFDKTTGGTVSISPNMSPASTTVSAVSGTYTFSGGPIDAGALAKSGGGTLVLAGANTYADGTTVSGGTLVLGVRNGLGSGAVTMAGGTAFHTSGFEGNTSGGALPNAFLLSGGNVTMDVSFGNKDIWLNTAVDGPGGIYVTGDSTRNPGLMLSGAKAFEGGVTLGSGAMVTVDDIDSLGAGTLRASSGVGRLRIAGYLMAGVPNNMVIAQNATLDVIVDSGRSAAFAGLISDEGSGGKLIKDGAGALTLVGSGSHLGGSFTMNSGTVTVGPAMAVGTVVLNLAGTVVNADNPLTVTNTAQLIGGTVSAGSPASFTLGGANLVQPSSGSHRAITAQGGAVTLTTWPGTDGLINSTGKFATSYNPASQVWTLDTRGNTIGDPQGDSHGWHYTEMSGDFDVNVHVSTTGGWNRAGLMVRNGTTASNQYAAVWDAGGNGNMAYNLGDGSGTHYAENLQSGGWVRIAKSGSTITLYAGPNSSTWTQLAQNTYPTWGAHTYLGLDINYRDGVRTFDHVTFFPATVATDWSTTDLAIGSGAQANLSYTGTMLVGGLTFNGVSQATGTWGATGSGATHEDNDHFTGAGTVTVTVGPAKIVTVLSALPSSQEINISTPSVALYGVVSDGGSAYPADGERVHITIGPVSGDATISGGAGAFAVSFPTALIPAGFYTITYTYDGNATLANTVDTSTMLAVIDPYPDWIDVYFSGDPTKGAKSADPDGDGRNNLAEFAFRGLPSDPASRGLFFTDKKNNKLSFTCAVRRSAADFAVNSDGAQTATIDGMTYVVEASSTLSGTWNSPVTSVSKSDSPPVGSGLPDLTNDNWEYRTFSAFDGLGGKGFLRARVTAP